MKALTIRQPYAALVMLGVKPYEFRTWRTNYRGPLAIHAGASWHTLARDQSTMSADVLAGVEMSRGVVLGVVDVVDCVSVREIATERGPWCRHSGVFDRDMYALVLDNVQPFAEPIPAKGLQGLWNWRQA